MTLHIRSRTVYLDKIEIFFTKSTVDKDKKLTKMVQ